MQAGRRRGSGDMTHRFFPDGRCFLASRFAGWSIPEGTAGRGRQSPQAGFRQRPGRAGRDRPASQGAWQGSAGCN